MTIMEVKELQRIERKPGDVFVIHADRMLTREQRAAIRASWSQVMGDAPLLIMEAGLRLGVVSGEHRTAVSVDGISRNTATAISDDMAAGISRAMSRTQDRRLP